MISVAASSVSHFVLMLSGGGDSCVCRNTVCVQLVLLCDALAARRLMIATRVVGEMVNVLVLWEDEVSGGALLVYLLCHVCRLFVWLLLSLLSLGLFVVVVVVVLFLLVVAVRLGEYPFVLVNVGVHHVTH